MSDDLAGGPPERPSRWTGVRRRWRAVAVLATVGAGVAVVGPQLSLHADGRSGGPAVEQPQTHPSARPVAKVASAHWPLRGVLAADDHFVAAALRHLRVERPALVRPVYAGQLPDGSRLLVATSRPAGTADTMGAGAWHVATGETVGSGRASDVVVLSDPADSLGWAGVGAGGAVYALALGPPRRLTLRFSPRVEFSGQGTPRRRWVTSTTDDGVVVVGLGRAVDPSVAVRTLGVASFVPPVLIPVAGVPRSTAADLRISGVGGPGYHGPDPQALREALAQETTEILDLRATTQRVIWSGVPWAQRRYALVLVTRADGLRFQALVGQQPDGGWFPGGVRALGDDQPDWLPWLLEPFTTQDATFLLCPTGRGRLVYRNHGFTSRLTIDDDGIVGLFEPASLPPSASGARVRIYGARGQLLVTTVLPNTGFDNPLAVRDP